MTFVQFSVSSLCSSPGRHKKEKKKDKDRERDRERRSDKDYSRDDREEHSNSKKKKSKDKDRERKSDGDKGDVKVGVTFDCAKPPIALTCDPWVLCGKRQHAVTVHVTNLSLFDRSPGIMMKKNKAMAARRNGRPGRILTTVLCLPSL